VISLNVNGKEYKVDVEPDTSLICVIRDHLGLTATKYGCGIGQCGACTALLDGEAVHSCARSVPSVSGKKITTLEGLFTGNYMFGEGQSHLAVVHHRKDLSARNR
jgi:isoquinoline 1-oxidoreductase alpha subunit